MYANEPGKWNYQNRSHFMKNFSNHLHVDFNFLPSIFWWSLDLSQTDSYQKDGQGNEALGDEHTFHLNI